MSTTKVCPDCKEQIHVDAYCCPHCHLGFPEYGVARRRKPYPVARIAFALLLALAFLTWLAN